MGKNSVKILSKTLTLLILIGTFSKSYGQTQQDVKPKSDFWNHVQFGGGFGIGLGSGYTDVTLAPSAIYNLNDYISIGAGLQGSIVSQKDFYSSAIYGVNVITLFNPVEEVQLSIELEQVRVNNTFRNPTTGTIKDNFWNTGLLLARGTEWKMLPLVCDTTYCLIKTKMFTPMP